MRCVLVCAHANIFSKRTKIIFERRRTDWNVVTIFMPSFGFSDRPTSCQINSSVRVVSVAVVVSVSVFVVVVVSMSMHAWHGNWLHSFIGNLVFSLFHIIVIVDSILPLDGVVVFSKYFSFQITYTQWRWWFSWRNRLPISFCVHVHVLECRFTSPEKQSATIPFAKKLQNNGNYFYCHRWD